MLFGGSVRDETEFNTLLREYLSQHLLSSIQHGNSVDYSIKMAYDSYKNNESTYNLIIQHPENLPESSRIFPPAKSINMSQYYFIEYVAKKINTNKIFPNGILIGIVRSLFKNIFSDKNYELNTSPNIHEFLSDGTKNTDIIGHPNPSQVQFIREQDFKEKTVYIHNLKYNAHYHWIETPSIEFPHLSHLHSGQQSPERGVREMSASTPRPPYFSSPRLVRSDITRINAARRDAPSGRPQSDERYPNTGIQTAEPEWQQLSQSGSGRKGNKGRNSYKSQRGGRAVDLDLRNALKKN